MERTIYPFYNSTDRYVVAAVAFSTENELIHYSVYTNTTYDACYEGYSQANPFAYRIHEAEVLHAVGNAINAYDIAGTILLSGSSPRFQAR